MAKWYKVILTQEVASFPRKEEAELFIVNLPPGNVEIIEIDA